MRKWFEIIKIEALLYVRDFFGFFFTFLFPVFMLLMYGSIYGNEPTPYFGGLGTMDVSVPAYSAMIIGVSGLMAFPMTIATSKENKIYKRFDATPSGKGVMIAAQAIVNFCMTLAGFILLFIVGKLAYDIRVKGTIFFIGPALLLSIASIFALGFFFTAIAPTAKMSNLLCYIAYFVMIFLSGSMMPKELFPKGVKQFSQMLPMTHVVNVLQGTFRGADRTEYQFSVIVLAGVFAFCMITGALLYKTKSWI